ncbi:thioredoxin domain-containing protein [Nocardia sp. NPDC060249]|uniref:thioredoxin domain-containing protein n=1 Tax=Nocardia sp. NPDC060249 TaxID=3347082 RepID=UPI0036676C9B
MKVLEVLENSVRFHEVVNRRDSVLMVLFHRHRDPNSAKTRLAYEKIAETCCVAMKFAMMEFDDWSRVVEEFRVTALPTILIFVHGVETGRILGSRTEAELRADLGRGGPRLGITLDF